VLPLALLWWLSRWLPMLRTLPLAAPLLLPLLLLLLLALPVRLALVRREQASLLLPLPLSSDGSHGSTWTYSKRRRTCNHVCQMCWS
jgi:hypothetical protein